MLKRAGRAAWRQLVPATTAMVVAAGAAGLVGAGPAAAADADGPGGRGHRTDRAVVDCRENPQALKGALTGAIAGDTLWVKGTCIGPFVINTDVTVRGLRHAVLDGNLTGPVVSVGATARVRLINLTIAHGNVPPPGATGAIPGGGGIYNLGTLELLHSTVRENSASDGGGIYNSNFLTVSDSTVERNTARANGGGIYNLGTAKLIHSTVRHNLAVTGGGIYNGGGSLTLSGSRVIANAATTAGAGIYNSATLNLIRSTVARNIASGVLGSGSGIMNAGGTVTVTLSRVRDNQPDNCSSATPILGCIG